MTTPITSIRSIARRIATAAVIAMCAGAVLTAAPAQAQAPAITWTAATASDTHPVTAVTCQAGSLCVAVDGNGGVLTSVGQPSATWTAASSIGTSNQLNAVACPSAGLCVAVDNNGNAYSTSTPTSTPWSLHNIDGSHHLTAVSCPTTTLCVAVDNAGNVLTSADGTTWAVLPGVDGSTALNGLSCPTASLCVAVDVTGHVLVSTTPTSSASWHATLLTTTSISLTAVSCNASGLCVATAHDGSVFATANVSAAAPTWSSTQLDSRPLSAVSCTDAGLCVAVDQSGTALSSDNPAGGPPSWTVTPIDSTNGMTAVSCVTAGFCAATDDLGNTVLGTLPAPTVTTGAGSASSQTAASVTGTVAPGDATVSDCHFEYGPTTSYGTAAPCATVPTAAGGAQAVSASLANLSAGTTYHFRVVAAGIASSAGADATFTTTPPVKANPSLSGTPAVGQTLTCKPNVTVSPPLTIAYQWLSDTVAIPSAVAPTYVVAVTDQTHHLSCYVTIAGDGGSVSANSGFDSIPSQTAGKLTETFVGTDAHGANRASAPVTCSPQATRNCTITLRLTAVKTVKHRRQTVAVGSTIATLAAGATKTLSVSLNAAGRQLVRAQHRLAVTLTVSGTVVGSLTATLQTDKLIFATKSAAKKARATHRRTHATRHPH